jgi:hypothetical protein
MCPEYPARVQSFFGSGMNHFLQTAEGMSAGDGMCMNIQ